MAAAAAGWVAGAAGQLQQGTLGPSWAYLGLAAAGLVVLAGLLRPAGARVHPSHPVPSAPRARRDRVVGWLAAALAAAACSAGLTGWRATDRLSEALPARLEGQDLVLTGRVADLPRHRNGGTRFTFAIESARHTDGSAARGVPTLVSLGWFDDDIRGEVEAALPAPVRAGERWRLTARLRQPHGALNPHGFDVELWWFEQGIRALGTVRPRAGDPPARLEAASPGLLAARQAMRDAIFERVPDAGEAGVLAALSLGDQDAIDRQDWDVFRRTGVSHLMAISGLHVTMFAWLAGALIGRAWRGSVRLLLWLPAPTAARAGGVLAALLYALFSGWGLPAQRTVCMLAVAAGLGILGVRWPWPVIWAASAVAVVAFDPWALLQPGFWLSFVAVGLLMGAGAGGEGSAGNRAGSWRSRGGSALRAALRTQAVATVGLAPLTLLFFQQISLVGFLANLVAIPLVSFMITPLALLGAAWAPLWDLGALTVRALLAGLTWLASWPWAAWTVAVAPPWAGWAALAGGWLLVLPLPWRWRLAGLPLLLPLLWPPVERPPQGHFEIVAADVGQGTAVLVRTARHLLVYDAGPQYGREGAAGDAGQRVLLPLLQARGERRIDTLMLSHRDADHVGGAQALLRGLPVGELLASLEAGHPLGGLGVPTRACQAGQAWSWDGVRFEVLHPFEPAAQAPAHAKPNTVSCVLRVSVPGGSVLLTGDIERLQELSLVEQAGARLRSDVFLVPHHGSRTSSSPELLQAVQPRVAVVQAGYRNRYGHPAPKVLARYAALGIPVVATPSCGAYTWRSGTAGRGGQGWCERVVAPRYWRHGMGGVAATSGGLP